MAFLVFRPGVIELINTATLHRVCILRLVPAEHMVPHLALKLILISVLTVNLLKYLGATVALTCLFGMLEQCLLDIFKLVH